MAQSVSLYTPVIYIAVLLSVLVIFSTVYRKRKLRSLEGMKPWYPTHTSRDIYETLAEMAPKPPTKVLTSALLRRATEDIRRVVKIREAKGALATLHQKGSVSDDLWLRFTKSEKLMELELQDCANEANKIKEGFASTLFSSAQEIAQNDAIRQRLGNLDKIRDDFKKEMENANITASKK
ncbi:hypothetical protein NADFUDRAFT_26211 [Nadsonia fulvescens var. elongata DSM 6958]|uniref:Uncharacterized protein n=1 Tax=Nadsonia fulvescens var. elongata DSM 6958 TaxID=857566 RepID=A0A1E3PIM7_9ASCO|nr:hypothetical protein NADFUDRAFT_26211 [Nadsonia fulvescens var. elongata DSM 6958]